MPRNDWLFDNQGRMRADLPPVLYPYGYAPFTPPQPTIPEINPPNIGGWYIKPKRWKNPFGSDWYGLEAKTPIDNVPIINRLFGYE